MVQATWGGWMVVPAFNVDVAIGVVRDGMIEPWTTRLVQELLRPGQTYINAGANFGYYPFWRDGSWVLKDLSSQLTRTLISSPIFF